MIVLLVLILFFYFEGDRKLRLRNISFSKLLETYQTKPHFKTKNVSRVVGLIETNDNLDLTTLKSIMDQSVRLNDIAVQTNNKLNLDEDVKQLISIHPPGTEWLRETDKNTVVINIKNGVEYPYDFVETMVEKKSSL
jgi:hypothetical protein